MKVVESMVEDVSEIMSKITIGGAYVMLHISREHVRDVTRWHLDIYEMPREAVVHVIGLRISRCKG